MPRSPMEVSRPSGRLRTKSSSWASFNASQTLFSSIWSLGTKKGDHRILIRMKNGASSIRSLVFDETGKEFQSAFVSTEYVYQKYLPPLQIVYSGDANTFIAIDEKTNLLNQSTFPEVSQFSMPDDIEKREKIKCIFEAIDGDMKTLKELVGARLINHHGSMILREKNNKLDKISCKDGKILSR